MEAGQGGTGAEGEAGQEDGWRQGKGGDTEAGMLPQLFPRNGCLSLTYQVAPPSPHTPTCMTGRRNLEEFVKRKIPGKVAPYSSSGSSSREREREREREEIRG